MTRQWNQIAKWTFVPFLSTLVSTNFPWVTSCPNVLRQRECLLNPLDLSYVSSYWSQLVVHSSSWSSFMDSQSSLKQSLLKWWTKSITLAFFPFDPHRRRALTCLCDPLLIYISDFFHIYTSKFFILGQFFFPRTHSDSWGKVAFSFIERNLVYVHLVNLVWWTLV